MKIFFLGTNGWYDTETGNTSCVLLDTEDRYIIFDAGTGLYKIDLYIKDTKPIYLLLSHFHLDHIFGLHILAKFDFGQGIDVFGPFGLKKLFQNVINKPYSLNISRLKTPIRLHEIKNKDIPKKGFEYKPLKHSVTCYGYRIYTEGKVVSYCTDTGICENLLYLAKETDLFICECAYRRAQFSIEWPHLNPESTAKIAKQAKAKKLVLIHFDASLYKTLKERKRAERIAKDIFPETICSYDGLEIKL